VTNDAAAAACTRLVEARQSERRIPSVTAAVFRGRDVLWRGAAGLANVETATPPAPDTQYRIGSITKTFTAVLVMQLRDAGALDLDDRLSVHLPGAAHGDATVRRLLAHLSGLQREPVGDVWESLVTPSREDLLGNLASAELVSAPQRRWHYSNLAYAVLGELVARLTGGSWEEALRAKILAPLGLSRTTTEPEPPYAQGYLVDPYADRVHEEPYLHSGGIAPAMQLWSTVDDLARWGAVLLDGADGVLASTTVDEMNGVHTMADESTWLLAWGLGLMLFRRPERIVSGHTGGMPGHNAALLVSRTAGVGAVTFANVTAGFDPGGFAGDLVDEWLEHDKPVEAWRPAAEPVPAAYEGLLGRWWTEGSEFVFAWRRGRLEALPVGAPKTAVPAVFEPDGDGFRTVSGREAGEPLRVVRDAGGNVTKLYWATYPLTRDPLVFGASR
jgi:CubicO group peptidase (beta-lactamase class C family)